MNRKAWLQNEEGKQEPVTVIAILKYDIPIAVIIRENGRYDWCELKYLTERKEK